MDALPDGPCRTWHIVRALAPRHNACTHRTARHGTCMHKALETVPAKQRLLHATAQPRAACAGSTAACGNAYARSPAHPRKLPGASALSAPTLDAQLPLVNEWRQLRTGGVGAGDQPQRVRHAGSTRQRRRTLVCLYLAGVRLSAGSVALPADGTGLACLLLR